MNPEYVVEKKQCNYLIQLLWYFLLREKVKFPLLY
jgi:hypothetical protein